MVSAGSYSTFHPMHEFHAVANCILDYLQHHHVPFLD